MITSEIGTRSASGQVDLFNRNEKDGEDEVEVWVVAAEECMC